MHNHALQAFLDELQKIALDKETRKAWNSSSTRSGKRPMSVMTLLKKEKDGTLGGYKLAFHSLNKVLFSNPSDPGAARIRKKSWEAPSNDDVNGGIKREDGRDFVNTVNTQATSMMNVGPFTSQSETPK